MRPFCQDKGRRTLPKGRTAKPALGSVAGACTGDMCQRTCVPFFFCQKEVNLKIYLKQALKPT